MPERRRLAHHVDREMLRLVPFDALRREVLRREGERHVADGDLVVGEGELGHERHSIPVMAGLDPAIHVSTSIEAWMAGPSPAMTIGSTYCIVGMRTPRPP